MTVLLHEFRNIVFFNYLEYHSAFKRNLAQKTKTAGRQKTGSEALWNETKTVLHNAWTLCYKTPQNSFLLAGRGMSLGGVKPEMDQTTDEILAQSMML